MARKQRWFVFCALLVACGGGASETPADDPSGGAASTTDGSSSGVSGRGDAEAKLSFESGSAVRVTTLEWGDGDRLLVGFADGSFAAVDPATSRYEHSKVSKGDYDVEAISPSGKFALIGSTPPAVLSNDGQAVLQMNPVKSYEGASFARDNLGIYVSDSEGKVRIWGQSHSFEEELTKEKLEDYLNRQAPDFHVQFGALAGPLTMSTDGVLLVGAADGTISVWNPRKPSSSKRIMKLDAPVAAFDAAGGVVVATSTNGQLKVGVLDPPGYKPWSRDARADYADVSNLLTDQFVSQTGNTVALRDVETGDEVWSKELPGSRACGVSVSQNARRIAVCVDDRVVFVDAETGEPRSYAWNKGGALGWKTTSGNDVSP
jgi:WD40 repeat protein